MASKGTRDKEEQIIRRLKEVESGMTVTEVCRKCAVASKYSSIATSELQRLRALKAENRRLKKIVAQKA